MPTPPPVTLDEVLRAAEFRRLLRRFLAHGDVRVRQAGLTPQRYLLLLAIKGRRTRPRRDRSASSRMTSSSPRAR